MDHSAEAKETRRLRSSGPCAPEDSELEALYTCQAEVSPPDIGIGQAPVPAPEKRRECSPDLSERPPGGPREGERVCSMAGGSREQGPEPDMEKPSLTASAAQLLKGLVHHE